MNELIDWLAFQQWKKRYWPSSYWRWIVVFVVVYLIVRLLRAL